MEERGLIMEQGEVLLEGTGGGSQADGSMGLVLTHCGCNNRQGVRVVVPHLLEHMGLHL